MSSTRRDILKTMTALGVGAALPSATAVHASEPAKPVHVFDSAAIRFDCDELLDVYCPRFLEGMIVVRDKHTGHLLPLRLATPQRTTP